MAGSAIAAGVVCGRGWMLGLCLAASLPLYSAEHRISLQELGSRNLPGFTARLAGQTVVVRGVVNAAAFHFTDYNLLAIEEGSYGGVLKVPAAERWLDRFRPGDEIEATGTVVFQYGVPMLAPEDILVVATKPAPAPVEISIRAAQDFRYLGRLIRLSGVVAEPPAPKASGIVAVLAASPE